ncbi:hypothetical protein BC937DRAFT_88355 [Endogone sp. FLAS-F59071]|nr:hypothetical protein BC937DRAFT_88355 [Endogone sp. FLAS-F59071]|eukprot:RUS22594.1 hypothetical protein BC937DRAFT_88355 [Endogone sp. FLAS-F59071]
MLQKLVNYWANQLITEKVANIWHWSSLLQSPLFNRMAATTHHHVSKLTDSGSQKATSFLKAFKEALEKERQNEMKKFK